MKKLLVGAAIAASMLLPASAASAAEAGPAVGVKKCPPGSVGVIVWIYNYDTGQQDHLVEYCIYTGP